MENYYVKNGLAKMMNNLLKQTMEYLENMPQEKIEKDLEEIREENKNSQSPSSIEYEEFLKEIKIGVRSTELTLVDYPTAERRTTRKCGAMDDRHRDMELKSSNRLKQENHNGRNVQV